MNDMKCIDADRAERGARRGRDGSRRHAGGGVFAKGFPGGGGRGWGMGPDGGGFGGGGARGGARRKRLFDQAELQLLMLALIVEAPRHGYELIREVEALSGGEYAPSPGVVYPALIFMEETGLIAPAADEASRSKAFAATERGIARVREQEDSIAELKGRLSALLEQRDRIDPAPVRRAFHALKTAVFDRLSQEGTDRDFILKVADVIDDATRTIERI
ncbi:PadR family transcriptional regulator [Novosphingobium panipatense]|uniref:Transcriptional regulator, PadR family n=1 Tax=Novosphingobium panipatense TaxID=428991 RepID=A0ABY1QMZ7_9SPHN|nr:PadR family transcriptional regulator [Novosphingobium panipatense]SMP74452.1 transcriptional regulator, PadR family [Novosphingobium panipatense]